MFFRLLQVSFFFCFQYGSKVAMNIDTQQFYHNIVKFLFQIGRGYRLALYVTAFGAMFATRYGLIEGIISVLPRKTITF
jgi:hypothetical protein